MKVGAKNDREIEIVDGVKEGDRILVKPASSVTHGQRHVAREEVVRPREGRDAVILQATLDFGLGQRGIEQGEVLVLVDEVGQDFRGLLVLAACMSASA